MGNQHRFRHDFGATAGRRIGALIAWLSCLAATNAIAQDGAQSGVLVETITLQQKVVSQTIKAYGTVEPDPDALVVVALPSAGLITQLNVRQGERVNAGDALLTLDTAPGTRMQYAQAAAEREYAAGQLERMKQLFDEQLATREQVANAQRALRDSEAQLVALQNVGAGRNRQTIRSSTNGIVTSISVNAGDRVAADTPALLVAQTSALIIRFGVEPEDARTISVDNPVAVSSVFQSDINFDSKLKKVNAMVNPSTRLVDVIATVPESHSGQMTLGVTMRGEIVLAEQMLTVVPRSAVLRDADGAHIFVLEDSKARRVAVDVLYESPTETAIAGNVRPGATVVQVGNYELQDGMRVRVSDASK